MRSGATRSASPSPRAASIVRKTVHFLLLVCCVLGGCGEDSRSLSARCD